MQPFKLEQNKLNVDAEEDKMCKGEANVEFKNIFLCVVAREL